MMTLPSVARPGFADAPAHHPHMLSCNYTRGPPLNTDISGIGVRISFYLQTLFLGTRASFV